MNRDFETYSVWIDGELKGKNLPVTTTSGDSSTYPSYGIEAFSVSQCYNNVAVFFDDVKVFSAPSFFVVPEVPLGTLMAFVATLAALSLYAQKSNLKIKFR